MSKPPVRPSRGDTRRDEPTTGVREAQPGFHPEADSPTTGVRGAIDALVQAALVDLFQAYGVSLAPLPRSELRRLSAFPEISAAITFTSGARSSKPGRLTLSIPSEVLEQMTNDPTRVVRHSDWARELANQLMGRIKNRLLQFSVRVTTGLPSNPDAKRLQAELTGSTALRIYLGRTLRGQVVATLEGMPKESELVYVGPECVATEGDMILF